MIEKRRYFHATNHNCYYVSTTCFGKLFYLQVGTASELDKHAKFKWHDRCYCCHLLLATTRLCICCNYDWVSRSMERVASRGVHCRVRYNGTKCRCLPYILHRESLLMAYHTKGKVLDEFL